MATKILTFKVTGTSDLLMNNPESMNQEGPSSRTKKFDPKREAEIRLYENKEGHFYIPTIAFLNSLWNGAAYEKIGKDAARSRIAAAIFCAEEESILLNKDTEEIIDDYEIDSRYVVVQKARIMRSRPKIKNWMCYVNFEVDDEYIPVEHIPKLFNKAGKVIGILDYRPQHRGPFGRYEVEIWQN